MQVVSSPEHISGLVKSYRNERKSIGLVPTMGALHHGHLSLIRRSQQMNDITVVSIFVNRLQFNVEEDYQNYPRPQQADKEFLKEHGVDILFIPEEKEMYPESPLVRVSFGDMANVMEGKYRPGHFDGVGIVVTKLLNQIRPDHAYFGLKDLQQYLLILRMVKDFSFETKIVGMPIVREASGLAMSSRNLRLSESGKEKAAEIYAGLELANQIIVDGANINETKLTVIDFYNSKLGLDIEYLSFVNPGNLIEFEGKEKPVEVAICVAGYVEGIRLIDNLYLRQD